MKTTTNEFQVKRLGVKDALLFQKLIHLFHEVFEMDTYTGSDEVYLNRLLENDQFVVLVIWKGDEVVGGLTGYELSLYYGKYKELYLYDMAIKQTFQRKGLGAQLIAELRAYCQGKGIQDFFVEAHQEDIHALEFYRAAGGKAEKVVHFNFDTEHLGGR
jgi:aminoglycoside 3-N-acetyltransferase I